MKHTTPTHTVTSQSTTRHRLVFFIPEKSFLIPAIPFIPLILFIPLIPLTHFILRRKRGVQKIFFKIVPHTNCDSCNSCNLLFLLSKNIESTFERNKTVKTVNQNQASAAFKKFFSKLSHCRLWQLRFTLIIAQRPPSFGRIFKKLTTNNQQLKTIYYLCTIETIHII